MNNSLTDSKPCEGGKKDVYKRQDNSFTHCGQPPQKSMRGRGREENSPSLTEIRSLPARRKTFMYLTKLGGLRKKREQSETMMTSQPLLLRESISFLKEGRCAFVPGNQMCIRDRCIAFGNP